MPVPPPADVTALLRAWSGGDAAALDALLPSVYEELRRLAALHMRRQPDGHTLGATAVVHEAFLRLVRQPGTGFASRAHFFAVASRVMRTVLVDHARAAHAAKRGGGDVRLDLEVADSDPGRSSDGPVDVLALDEALTRYAALDPDGSRVVELRWFTGLTIEETAEVLDVSPATVKRHWTAARAWLRRELTSP